jgi:hypothetical protein
MHNEKKKYITRAKKQTFESEKEDSEILLAISNTYDTITPY